MSAPHVIAGSENWPSDLGQPVVTFGNFDGVHRGHRALLERTIALAKAHGAIPTAFTFDPAPQDILRPHLPHPRVQTLEDRIAALGRAGIQAVVVEPFSKVYAGHDASWFASEVIDRRLQARAVVVGWDFRFGRGRGGSVETLREHLNIPVEQIGAKQEDEAPISSSRIRGCIAAGDLVQATRLLDRPHETVGRVVPGDARGTGLGFPTANIDPENTILPPVGVYAVQVVLADRTISGVANLGLRPTFESEAEVQPRIEVHLLDFDGDLYGHTLRVRWIAKVRDEVRFDSVEALVQQIERDVQRARTQLASAGHPE